MKNLFDLQRFGQYLVRAGLAFLIAYLLFSILGPYLVAWGVEADKSGMLIGSIMQYLGTQFQAFTNPIIGILLLTIGLGVKYSIRTTDHKTSHEE
ncbi:hypothetical protein EBF03_06435 [Arcanobacterium haemolyticum]|uniref:Uncharacterized protein n=1 Tax=Arcanobacterium haemolyticum (strain ATCC 9345 / DSM 20595 / CCM 5947 / CCUG 17215 / LMG 16163 / NBRC 15585 / NCTC 8452 / 11018) TaxID=644284 RepID=D7BK33_ARCHD|nr:hypothetical protein [Arcanobacterium haemolyticum]ADH93013.1 hypothetical protein Arch_1310 [Arcanobacterium haemolyticum DSM 20595]QCX47081.1 hypothetical protein EBF03_06435 [Arcanobacterium haemolyticum]SQH28230.1 Uncharacterised protein [Arcanobacterium haemolyticum]